MESTEGVLTGTLFSIGAAFMVRADLISAMVFCRIFVGAVLLLLLFKRSVVVLPKALFERGLGSGRREIINLLPFLVTSTLFSCNLFPIEIFTYWIIVVRILEVGDLRLQSSGYWPDQVCLPEAETVAAIRLSGLFFAWRHQPRRLLTAAHLV